MVRIVGHGRLPDDHPAVRAAVCGTGDLPRTPVQVAAADHYYQFTVNSAGARSRTYNEGQLDRPLFEAAVGRTRRGWVAEMRIPFASAGIEDPRRARMFLNLFRFRPPDMAGWRLPAIGSYAPMPFGRLELLPAEQSERRTVEAPAEMAEAERAPADTAVQAKLDWYPLARRVVGQVRNGTGTTVTAALRVPTLPETLRRIPAGATQRLIVALPESAALPSTAEMLVVSDVGEDTLARETMELTPVEAPEWLGTQVASEYLHDKVPWPWTRPEVSGDTLHLQHAGLSFGRTGLYRAVQLAGDELLAGEGAAIIWAGGRTLTQQPWRWRLSRQGSAAIVSAVLRLPGGFLDVHSVVGFDGFTLCKLRLRGVPPETIERLAVQFPLRKENARFVHRLLVQDIRRLTGFGWESPAGPVWLGGHERGLAFDSDTPLFLSTRRRSQVQVIEEADRVWLRLNLVDAAGQVPGDGHVLRFTLQPTPVRRVSLNKDGLGHADLWFEEWSDYQGYPDLAKSPEVKRRPAQAHAGGRPFVVYFSQMLAENSPGFSQFRSEFIVPPGLMWYKRAYDPGRGVPCWVCCPRGPYGDLLLHGMDRLAREGDLDGVYMDGTTVPWDCDSPSHPACDGATPVTWEGHEPTAM